MNMPDPQAFRRSSVVADARIGERDEIVDIEVRDSQWYALGRRTVYIRRARGQSVRLMAPAVPGVPDGTENLGHLLRAWWRSDPGRLLERYTSEHTEPPTASIVSSIP